MIYFLLIQLLEPMFHQDLAAIIQCDGLTQFTRSIRLHTLLDIVTTTYDNIHKNIALERYFLI